VCHSTLPPLIILISILSIMASINSNDLFKYLLIPADPSVAIETKTADKAGGLEDDELAKSAKNYFFERSGAAEKSLLLKQASTEQRSQLAQRWRDQQSATQQNKKMQMAAAQLSEEQILSLLESQQASPSCEIMALTVPTKGNSFQAVSMYLSQEPQTDYNQRASQLLQACGHALPEQEGTGKPAGIYGDAFVGRCHDDEQGDEWSRIDFTEADLLNDSNNSTSWMTVAKASGGGGGSGSSNVSSLTGTLSQMGYQPTPEQQADGYKWEQTNDQVELKFVVPAGTKAKQCQVKFQRSSLRVQVHGEMLAEGSTGGNCVVDDCTYTLQEEGNASDPRRELCVVLEKSEPGIVWAHAVQKTI
jgi:hypothetical protein